MDSTEVRMTGTLISAHQFVIFAASLDDSGLQDSCRIRLSQQSCSALINQLVCNVIWLKKREMTY